MSKKGFINIWLAVLIAAVLVGGGYVAVKYLSTPGFKNPAPVVAPPNTATSTESLITIALPAENSVVSSPLIIKGQTRKGWVVFEAQAGTATLYDANGQKLGFAILKAVGEWMKTEVDFVGTLTFEKPTTETGKLVFKDDNPQDEALSKTYELPVKFLAVTGEPAVAKKTVNLFYYNAVVDRDVENNALCDQAAILPVEREIAVSLSPIRDTIDLLLKGELTGDEKENGFKTEFPLAGLSLNGASLKNGTLTLEFNDPGGKTTGGSCRVGILWGEIVKTARQFPEVRDVRFVPLELFQP
jgi:hypothetical protein